MVLCLFVMDLCTVTTILSMQLDGWDGYGPHYCPVKAVLDGHRKTSVLLGACGHDNRELEGAITAVGEAFEKGRTALELAVARFEADGVCFTVD